MATFTVKIDTDNDAFEGNELRWEINRILRDIATTVATGKVDIGYFQTIHDSNGNDVGRWALKNEDGSPAKVERT